jgi:hypothetical protein
MSEKIQQTHLRLVRQFCQSHAGVRVPAGRLVLAQVHVLAHFWAQPGAHEWHVHSCVLQHVHGGGASVQEAVRPVRLVLKISQTLKKTIATNGSNHTQSYQNSPLIANN